VVLERVRITEIGTHDELLQKSGTYRRLHDLQFGAEPELVVAETLPGVLEERV